MSKKLLVGVVYEGEIDKAYREANAIYGSRQPIYDTRFQPFVSTNEERAAAEPVTVKVANWVISDVFRRKFAEHDLLSTGGSALDFNTVLTLFSHFGFEMEYDRRFAQRLEPWIADVMLQAYKVDIDARISPRLFHGEIMERSRFYEMFDNFLVKYGM